MVEASDELNKVRKTKMVCTIWPTSCTRENLFRLAAEVCFQPPSTYSWSHFSAFLYS